MKGKAPVVEGVVIPIEEVTIIQPKGWKLGDPVSNLTSKGNRPSWGTVRSRYWKNKALNAEAGDYSTHNIARMKRGSAPKLFDPGTGKKESVELYHTKGREGVNFYKFEEVLPSEHAEIDPHRHLKKT